MEFKLLQDWVLGAFHTPCTVLLCKYAILQIKAHKLWLCTDIWEQPYKYIRYNNNNHKTHVGYDAILISEHRQKDVKAVHTNPFLGEVSVIYLQSSIFQKQKLVAQRQELKSLLNKIDFIDVYLFHDLSNRNSGHTDIVYEKIKLSTHARGRKIDKDRQAKTASQRQPAKDWQPKTASQRQEKTDRKKQTGKDWQPKTDSQRQTGKDRQPKTDKQRQMGKNRQRQTGTQSEESSYMYQDHCPVSKPL